MVWINVLKLTSKLIGKSKLVKLFFVFFIIAVTETLLVIILSYIINTIVKNIDINLFFYSISMTEFKFTLLIIISVFSVIIGYLGLNHISSTVFNLGARLSELYYKDTFLVGLKKYNGIRTDELERKIHYDILRTTDGYILPLFVLISKLILLSIILVVVVYILPQILILILIAALLFLPVLKYIKKKSKKIGDQLTENYTQRLVQMSKSLDLFREFTIYGLWNKNLKEFNSTNDEIASNRSIIYTYKGMSKYIIEASVFVLVGVSFLIIRNTIVFDLKNISVIVLVGFKALPILQQSIVSLNTINFSRDLTKELVADMNKILSQRIKVREKFTEIQTISLPLKLVDLELLIEERSLFKNISFEINDNSKLLISGSSGSGKSTLVDVLCGFKDITHGQIISNEKPITLLNNKNWQKNISYCGQHSYLIKGTILENMRIVNSMVSVDEIYELISKFNFLNPLLKNKDIIENKFFEFDKSFSGGELQKFSIIRSVLANRNIYVFDEPTSSLDRMSEEKFGQIISKFLKNKCIIIITHSSSLKNHLLKNEFLDIKL